MEKCRDWPPGQSYREAAQKGRTVEDAGPYQKEEWHKRTVGDAGPYQKEERHKRTVGDAGPYKDVPHFRFPVIPTKAQPRGGIRSLLPGKRILRLRCAPLRMTRWC